MKNRIQTIVLCLSFIILSQPLCGNEHSDETPRYEWIDAKDLAITENGVYIPTHRGLSKLEVKDYDEKTDRYLADCRKVFEYGSN